MLGCHFAGSSCVPVWLKNGGTQQFHWGETKRKRRRRPDNISSSSSKYQSLSLSLFSRSFFFKNMKGEMTVCTWLVCLRVFPIYIQGRTNGKELLGRQHIVSVRLFPFSLFMRREMDTHATNTWDIERREGGIIWSPSILFVSVSSTTTVEWMGCPPGSFWHHHQLWDIMTEKKFIKIHEKERHSRPSKKISQKL